MKRGHLLCHARSEFHRLQQDDGRKRKCAGIDPGIGDVLERLRLAPEDWCIEQAFPDPFNAMTHFRITSSTPQPFEVSAFNILGQQVARVWQGVVAKDEPTLVNWDARGPYASGIYYLVARPTGPGAVGVKSVKVVLSR